ncbi:MAG: 5-oxoprolinase subunit PxpA [Candidatus Rokubacteria bacterium]|nr:5-oxoprolinase subunit PxpA [Candidatus Rokubacteria bacterium]
MAKEIDINCDMGESFGRYTLGHDEEVMPWITSANIACGFHGGDPHVMRRTVELALRHGVAVGAHPGLPDLLGFGRRALDVSPQELKDYHRYQTGALWAFARVAGTELQHVKPHGIQYSMYERSPELARAAAEGVMELDKALILFALAGTRYEAEAKQVGARVASEGFADRRYAADKQLVSRKIGPRALISDPAEAAEQAVLMALEGKVRTLDGQLIDVEVQTICIHGDTPDAHKIVRAVREGLERAGARVRPLREWFRQA